MNRLALISIASFYNLPLPAQADNIPRYNVENYCQEVADISGGSAMIYNGCIDIEQQSYNSLKSEWIGISPKSKSYCDEVATISGGSYSILKGCIDMENSATNTPNSFKY